MKAFLKGFVYAGKGVFLCFAKERNMRFHLCIAVYMFCYLTIYDFFEISKAEYGVLLALCGLVLSLEAVNTAIERAVNLASPDFHPLAGQAKDAAAGAVLIAAVFSVIAGFVIMYQPEAFRKMFEYYKANPAMLAALALSIVLSIIFVFLPGYVQKRKEG